MNPNDPNNNASIPSVSPIAQPLPTTPQPLPPTSTPAALSPVVDQIQTSAAQIAAIQPDPGSTQIGSNSVSYSPPPPPPVAPANPVVPPATPLSNTQQVAQPVQSTPVVNAPLSQPQAQVSSTLPTNPVALQPELPTNPIATQSVPVSEPSAAVAPSPEPFLKSGSINSDPSLITQTPQPTFQSVMSAQPSTTASAPASVAPTQPATFQEPSPISPIVNTDK